MRTNPLTYSLAHCATHGEERITAFEPDTSHEAGDQKTYKADGAIVGHATVECGKRLRVVRPYRPGALA
jgi:hypothetical protein